MISMVRRRYRVVSLRSYCSERAKWLFHNDINIPEALQECDVTILVLQRRYMAIPQRSHCYKDVTGLFRKDINVPEALHYCFNGVTWLFRDYKNVPEALQDCSGIISQFQGCQIPVS